LDWASRALALIVFPSNIIVGRKNFFATNTLAYLLSPSATKDKKTLTSAANNNNNKTLFFQFVFLSYFAIFSLPMQVSGFEPLILGLLVECSATVLLLQIFRVMVPY
jgi:hypothetical protein